jgi:SAM-dependent methyltransferase
MRAGVPAPLRAGLAAADRLHERAFVAGYTRVQERSEAAGMRAIRRALVADARGRVLEVGAGTGLNVAHYGADVDELLLVEPAPAMRAALEDAARGSASSPSSPAPSAAASGVAASAAGSGEAASPAASGGGAPAGSGPAASPASSGAAASPAVVRVLDGTGEALPAADGSVDTVVGTFVLCSVEDPAAVLREVARVLRPGGRYLGLEHVRADSRLGAGAQDAVAPAWRFAIRGCRCNQDAVALVDASPLTVGAVERFAGPRQPWPVRPGVRIAARRP